MGVVGSDSLPSDGRRCAREQPGGDPPAGARESEAACAFAVVVDDANATPPAKHLQQHSGQLR